MTLTFSDAEAMMRRARNGYRRLGNNTYLHPGPGSDPDEYRVRYHYTNVVTIHRDGTWTLNSGGWDTPTTKQQINDYGPARVYSQGGTWAVWHKEDPRTPPKMQRCRQCHGAGRVREAGWRSYYEYDSLGRYRRIFPPVIHLPRWAKCWNCDGTGRRDCGSKPMPVIFYDGIRVDAEGRVVTAPGTNPERLNDPERAAREREARRAAEREAREYEARRLAESRPAANPGWLERHGLEARDGEVIMFKAVRDDLSSHHGTRYVPGTEVTAEDYADTIACGQGLHFSPTPRMAMTYDRDATRYLACAVDLATMIILDGGGTPKAKARSCRVLYEVYLDGSQVPEPEPEPEASGLDPAVSGPAWGSYGYRE